MVNFLIVLIASTHSISYQTRPSGPRLMGSLRQCVEAHGEAVQGARGWVGLPLLLSDCYCEMWLKMTFGHVEVGSWRGRERPLGVFFVFCTPETRGSDLSYFEKQGCVSAGAFRKIASKTHPPETGCQS